MTGSIYVRPLALPKGVALPQPIATNWEWQMRAACRGLNTDLFFKSDQEPRSRKRSREAQAKAVCAECPVARQCLDWAFSVGEAEGVWGGMTADERDAVRRRNAG